MLRIKRAYFNIDWHEKESICAQRLADLSRLRPILKGAGWLSVRFPRTAFFGSTGQAGTGRFHLSGPKTVTDGAFLPDPQIHAPGTGSGKERIYPPPKKKGLSQELLSPVAAGRFACLRFLWRQPPPPPPSGASAGRDLRPHWSSPGTGLEAVMGKGGSGTEGGFGSAHGFDEKYRSL